MSSVKSLPCPFRTDVRQNGHHESACCQLANQLVHLQAKGTATESCRVPRMTCDYCFGDGQLNVDRLTDVIASLVLAETQTDPSPSGKRLNQLAVNLIAKSSSWPSNAVNQLAAGDVVLVLNDTTQQAAVERWLQAWQKQAEAVAFIHLIAGAAECDRMLMRFRDQIRCQLHPYDGWCHAEFRSFKTPIGQTFAAIQALIGKFNTPFLAIGDVNVCVSASHLARGVGQLHQHGGEIYAAVIESANGAVHSSSRTPSTLLQPASLIFRRATYVDMGGIAACDGDVDLEWVQRALAESRKIVIDSGVIAGHQLQHNDCEGLPIRHAADAVRLPNYPRCLQTREESAIGFPDVDVPCDVVLPFHGQLDLVSEAIESVLAQTYRSFVLHLIDDGTLDSEDQIPVDDWLLRYSDHPQIRIYRNERNIGQFLSVNAVLPYLQSNWMVIHDGDDRSLPDRLRNVMKRVVWSNCDLAGTACEMFGLQSLIDEISMTKPDEPPLRYSKFPRTTEYGYFSENPTAIHRRDYFTRLGGFTDFGFTIGNRTANDTEYQLRAAALGADIAAFRVCTVQYRLHERSVTQSGETGLRSLIRRKLHVEINQRIDWLRRHRCPPDLFGGLRHTALTKPWKHKHA